MENSFDRHIRKMLGNLEGDQNLSDWSRMEEALDAEDKINPEVEDVYLDGMAYDTLNNFEVDYNPNHWDLMKERLDDPYAIRRRLMKYKVVEIAVVALFLLTLVQFFPEGNINIEREAGSEELALGDKEPEKVAKAPSTKQTDLIVKNETAAQDSRIKKQTLNNNTNQSAKAITPTTTANIVLPVAANVSSSASSTSNNNNSGITEESTNIESEESNSTNSTPIVKSTIIEIEEDLALEKVSDFNMTELDVLDLKSEDRFKVSGIEELNGGKIFTDLRKPIKVRIGMVLGPDANYVMTPSNKAQGLDVFNQVAVGYTGGFTLGFKYNRFEFEMGALYSAVSYGSRNIYEIKGSFADGGYVQQGLQGAKLDIIRIPFNFKYNFVERGKWNVYAFSGVSANVAAKTFFNYTTQDLGSSDASRNFVGRGPSSPEVEPEAANKNYDGIFEGGTISKNTFFSGNLGFGVERYFTPRMSIFVQPNYQYQLSNGLGPQGDKVNSISILTGAKVTLKKRKK